MKKIACIFIFLLKFILLHAQDQGADNLRGQFSHYQSVNVQEKLFVHTDKTFYLAGETVWFKIYLVDASSHKPVVTSSIGYIEILNSELKPVVQTKVPITKGDGNGSVILPGFLATGNYILRAYTSWMRNFSPDFYFERTIHIVNTLKISTALPPAAKTPPSIQFFPEGGTEVYGFTGKIAFKAMDREGHGLDCRGAVINQNNDTVVRFQSLHNGMGSFQLKPEKNSTYYAVVKLNDSTIRQKLPDASECGFLMSVTEAETGKLKIDVRATGDYNNTPVYLFAHTRQLVKNVQVNVIKDGSAQFTIDKKELGDGISSLTLFNNLRQPVCERLIFKRPAEWLNIQAKADQIVYNTRKPVHIDISTVDADSHFLPANLSLSVFMIDSLQHIPELNIVSWLLLNSDLKGRIESPEYYFNNPDKTVDEALDNLLLTQGWRRFKWNDVLENAKPNFEFLPEKEGPVVNGHLINKTTGATVGGAGAWLSIPGADYAFSSATSDAGGLVRFGLKDVYKNNVLIVQPALMKDSNYRVDIFPAFSDKFSSKPFRTLALSRTEENILLSRSVSNQVENTYAMEKKRQFVKMNLDTTSFYGRADKIYNLEDYVKFQTMEEVMREYVDDVRVRKEGEKFNFKVRNRLFNTYFEEDPLILLDGIPVADASKIIALDPAKIRKIELVLYNYYLGSSIFEGIVNVKSYSGELGAAQIDPNSLVVEYEGLQQQREFYSPKYDSREAEESHLPDFRNVLYWAPQIQTGSDGKSQMTFYTSDLKGKFAVVVQGITAEGVPGRTTTLFDVTSNE